MTDEQFAQLRSQFQIPENMVYLDGNSLGALPKMTQSRMTDVISRQWAGELVTGWNTCDWIDLPLSVGDQIAPIVGAAAGSIAHPGKRSTGITHEVVKLNASFPIVRLAFGVLARIPVVVVGRGHHERVIHHAVVMVRHAVREAKRREQPVEGEKDRAAALAV